MPGPSPSDRPVSADTVIIVVRPRLASVVCAARRTVRKIMARQSRPEGCPERFEFAFYRWIWNYTRDRQPRRDAAYQRRGHLRVIELRTRRSMDESLETI